MNIFVGPAQKTETRTGFKIGQGAEILHAGLWEHFCRLRIVVGAGRLTKV